MKKLTILLIMSALHLCAYGQTDFTQFPKSFVGTQPNEITGANNLKPFFTKLLCGRNVEVMQIGDSHVRGLSLPRALGARLENLFPASDEGKEASLISFHYHGINGARVPRYCSPELVDTVRVHNPDLIIVSFGTNEAHETHFSESRHQHNLDSLVALLREACPNAVFLLTTPPGSHVAKVKNGAKVPQAMTESVCRATLDFADKNACGVWDLWHIGGGFPTACDNWRRAGLMRPDLVHYQPEGYRIQGRLCAEAIFKAYKDFEAMLMKPAP